MSTLPTIAPQRLRPAGRTAGPTPVHAVGAAALPPAARTLAAAFADDPVSRWMLPRTGRLEPALRLFLERVWVPRGACFSAGEGDAVAAWVAPGGWHLGRLEQLRLLPAMAAALRQDLPRAMTGAAAFEDIHPERPHWYLPMIGVRPEAQGRGLGSILLDHMLFRCDAERMPAYLEATTPRSRALYERHGFAVTREVRMPEDGPPFWPMWREPRRAA